MTFDGRAEFAVGGVRFEQDATYRLNFPQHLVAGWSYRPTPAWNFEVNMGWTDWHAVDTAALGLPGGDTEVRFDWESGFIYEFGVTRTLGPRLALSAGSWYAEPTIPGARYQPIVPDVALHVFSAGVARRWGGLGPRGGLSTGRRPHPHGPGAAKAGWPMAISPISATP